MNNICTYRSNTKVISVTLPTGYSGYTVNFTVNDKEFSDDSNVITVSGVTPTNQVALIEVTSTQNDIEEQVYFYQVDMVKADLKYTIAIGSYTVLPSITASQN